MDETTSAKLYQEKSADAQLTYGLQLLSYVDIHKGEKICEIGCGCGNLAAKISSLVGESGEVVAIDPDVNRIKAATMEYANLKNISFISCKSIDFPIDKYAQYDSFLSNAVLHWIPTDEKKITFERIMNALKPGGVFVGNISFNRSANMRAAAFLLTNEEQEIIDGFYYRENREILQKLLEDAGFEIVEFKHRYCEVNLGSVSNFFEWITGTYYGRFDFKRAYNERKEDVKLLTFQNGDVKHTSEGALFVVKKPKHF